MASAAHASRGIAATRSTRAARAMRALVSRGRRGPSRGPSSGSVDRTSRIPAFLDQAWGVSVDQKTLTETIPQQLFAFSIIPYAGFLYHLTKSKQAPKLTLLGFYFLLVFVFATIPAGIYAKKVWSSPSPPPIFLASPLSLCAARLPGHQIHTLTATRIRACQVYQTTLANVDYLHGSAEFMLTLTNLFIVVGLKMAIDDARKRKDAGVDVD